MNKIWSTRKRKLVPMLVTLLCLLTLGILLYTGVIWPNYLFVSDYNVRGIDVSSYQKDIDWKSLAQTGEYTFVFIKATEGKNYKDPYFLANWRGAKEHGLLRGAYHFYRENRTPAEQAENYISMVPKEAGMLPPVLDLEVAGPNRQVMLREIQELLDRLEHYYGVKPIIYTDHIRYAEYVKENFKDYVLWIRDVLTPIQWTDVKNWTFWQYCNRGHVPGIVGFVDLNVFYGDRAKLYELAL